MVTVIAMAFGIPVLLPTVSAAFGDAPPIIGVQIIAINASTEKAFKVLPSRFEPAVEFQPRARMLPAIDASCSLHVNSDTHPEMDATLEQMLTF